MSVQDIEWRMKGKRERERESYSHPIYSLYSYSPPHVKRKRKIEEMATHFGRRLTPAGLYTELISTSSSTTTTSNLSTIPSPSLES